MDRVALPGDIVSAGGMILTDGAMAVGVKFHICRSKYEV